MTYHTLAAARTMTAAQLERNIERCINILGNLDYWNLPGCNPLASTTFRRAHDRLYCYRMEVDRRVDLESYAAELYANGVLDQQQYNAALDSITSRPDES